MPLQHHYGGYIRALSNALEADMRQSLEQIGLTPIQGMFLHFIWYRQEVQRLDTYAKDLEQSFDIKHPTVSGILQRMEASGLVEFAPSLTDRRCKQIQLTQKAMDANAHAIDQICRAEAKLTQTMTPTETQEFLRLLRIAADNMGVCHGDKPFCREKEESKP